MTLSAYIGELLRSSLTYPLWLYEKFLVCLIRWSSGTISARISKVELIGPESFVEQCKNVLEELRLSSFELYDALVNRDPLTICLVPGFDKSNVNQRMCVIGGNYLKWGEEGLRAYLVYEAFQVRANLHRTSVNLDDWYDGRPLGIKVVGQTVSWLRDHHQPEALIRYTASVLEQNPHKK